MPQHNYLGKKNRHLVQDNEYEETRVTFRELCTSPKVENIKFSESQRSLNDDKVESMLNEYIENKHFLKFKNRIVICIYNDKWYLVDGQHRIEMAKRYYNEYQIDDELIFCWYHCNNENNIRSLFNSLNKDSVGNQYYINETDTKQFIIDDFIKYMNDNYKRFFNKSDNNSSRIYSLSKIRDLLITINYFDNFENGFESYNNLINKNKEFYDKCSYDKDIQYNNLDDYYKDDQLRIENKFIIPCKNSQFITWLETNDENNIYHHRKKMKKPISAGIRKKVWEYTFNNDETGICPITRCNTILKKDGKGGFQAGHIISEKNGGKTEFTNLRPICSQCNQQMAHNNWCDYDSISYNKIKL
jgi:5-methylcytosine-specific restriction endonuclease McrA